MTVGWHMLEARTLEDAREELQRGYVATLHGFLDPFHLWSVTRSRHAIVLDVASIVEPGQHVLIKPCGHAPDAFDVPDEVLRLGIFRPKLSDDRVYATWLAKVLYTRTLLSTGDFDLPFATFHASRRDLHWWK